MAKYHGKKGLVYMSPDGTGVAVLLGELTEWSLNMTVDREDVTAFGDTNKEYVQGIPDRTGTLAGWWDDTDDALYDGMASEDGVKLYLYPSEDVLTKYFYGPALVDMSINVPVGGAVNVSGTFAANGPWGQK